MTNETAQEDLGSAQRVQRKLEGVGHLVISRGRGEKIVIGDGIVVEVSAIQGSRVKLLVTAPHATSIRRS